jgi:hypothetical protein
VIVVMGRRLTGSAEPVARVLYQTGERGLCPGVRPPFATRHDALWLPDTEAAVRDDAPHPTQPSGHPTLHLVPVVDEAPPPVRNLDALPNAQEVGAWSLEYLGPGFHVQLRIVRRNRHARLDGWMSPPKQVTVLLASLVRKPTILETRVGPSGRFEFPAVPTGACRMSFVLEDGRPPSTPPFWV